MAIFMKCIRISRSLSHDTGSWQERFKSDYPNSITPNSRNSTSMLATLALALRIRVTTSYISAITPSSTKKKCGVLTGMLCPSSTPLLREQVHACNNSAAAGLSSFLLLHWQGVQLKIPRISVTRPEKF